MTCPGGTGVPGASPDCRWRLARALLASRVARASCPWTRQGTWARRPCHLRHRQSGDAPGRSARAFSVSPTGRQRFNLHRRFLLRCDESRARFLRVVHPACSMLAAGDSGAPAGAAGVDCGPAFPPRRSVPGSRVGVRARAVVPACQIAWAAPSSYGLALTEGMGPLRPEMPANPAIR